MLYYEHALTLDILTRLLKWLDLMFLSVSLMTCLRITNGV